MNKLGFSMLLSELMYKISLMKIQPPFKNLALSVATPHLLTHSEAALLAANFYQ